MKATEKPHELGQSLWLDNITRDLLTTRTMERYIRNNADTPKRI
jgi:transaldolase